MNIKSLTLYSVLLLGAEYLFFSVLGLFMLSGPDLAPMAAPAHQPEILWAPVHVSKPGAATVPVITESPLDVTPTETAVDIIGDTPVNSEEQLPEYQEPSDGRWIDVNLSEQQIYAYEGDVVVNSFIVSTGVYATPTVTGEFRIYVKVPMQDMSGPGYYLPDVPWVMFFYDEYGFHGTYWHNNFGTPMSRGCVNLRTDDAEWLYHWASVGTPVIVHY